MADDYNDQLNAAQQTVRTFNRPYAMLGNGFGQPHLPGFLQHIPFIGQKVEDGLENLNMDRVNSGLNNALLAGALTPEAHGPEGAGGGITRALQGVLGVDQYNRQRSMQQAMLPYQMMMPRLQAENMASEIDYRKKQGAYDESRSNWYDKRLEGADNPKMIGQSHTDDSGRVWHEVQDPNNKTRPERLFDPIGGKYADELGPNEQPSFKNNEKQQRVAGNGGYEGDLIKRINSTDPQVRLQAQAEKSTYEDLEKNKSYNSGYNREKGAQDAPHADSDKRDFIKQQTNPAIAYRDIQKPAVDKNMEEFSADPSFAKEPDVIAYKKGKDDYTKSVQQRDQEIGKWSQSDAPSRGIDFWSWKQNGGASAAAAPQQSSTPSSSTPWRPK